MRTQYVTAFILSTALTSFSLQASTITAEVEDQKKPLNIINNHAHTGLQYRTSQPVYIAETTHDETARHQDVMTDQCAFKESLSHYKGATNILNRAESYKFEEQLECFNKLSELSKNYLDVEDNHQINLILGQNIAMIEMYNRHCDKALATLKKMEQCTNLKQFQHVNIEILNEINNIFYLCKNNFLDHKDRIWFQEVYKMLNQKIHESQSSWMTLNTYEFIKYIINRDTKIKKSLLNYIDKQ